MLPIYDTTGTQIRVHDVLRNPDTGEMAFVVKGRKAFGVYGLGIHNPVTGSSDCLDIFPDGVWTIVGNLAVTGEE